MYGFKVFNKDLKCRDFQYEVGKVYKQKERPVLCKSGFHFCEKISDVFNYYDFDSNNRVCKVVALGAVDYSGGDKMCTDEIFIEEELSWYQVLDLCNTGKGNTGLGNSGNRNSGNRNSGHYNSGLFNLGNYNSGDYNSGYANPGNYNSGHCNSGNRNSGNRNSGHYNSGDYNTGHFNTTEPNVRMFNKETNLKRSELYIPRINLKLTEWIPEYRMTEEQKNNHPEYKNIGGFLQKRTYKEAWSLYWKEACEESKQKFLKLPNFDAKIFEEITGIKI